MLQKKHMHNQFPKTGELGQKNQQQQKKNRKHETDTQKHCT